MAGRQRCRAERDYGDEHDHTEHHDHRRQLRNIVVHNLQRFEHDHERHDDRRSSGTDRTTYEGTKQEYAEEEKRRREGTDDL